MGQVMTVAPTEEPLSLAEAKLSLRVDIDDDDNLILEYISAARQVVENLSGRALVTQTWRYTADYWWCGDLLLRPAPLATVTTIKYYDLNGTQQTASSALYTVDTDHLPGRVALAYNQSWPSARVQPNSIEVIFTAGYGDAEDVPLCAKQAIRYLVAHQYENREPVIVGSISEMLDMTINAMIDPIRLMEVS